VTFSTAFSAGTTVTVTGGVRDQATQLSANNCLFTIANVSVTGFTAQWRNLNGNTCAATNAITINYYAVAAR
jgi:hypothetical protein